MSVQERAAATTTTATTTSPPLPCQEHVNVAEEQTVVKVIATHDGIFHGDEVTAYALLTCLPQFKGATLIRSRQPADWERADIVIDVGGVYDPAKGRFDHHQTTFNDTFYAHKTSNSSSSTGQPVRLSSLGLVYKHFGKEFIEVLLKEQQTSAAKNDSERAEGESGREERDEEQKVELIYHQLYERFVKAIDAADNGVLQFGNSGSHDAIAVPPNYVDYTGLYATIQMMNVPWHQHATPDLHLEHFMAAAQRAKESLLFHAHHVIHCIYPAITLAKRVIVTAAANSEAEGEQAEEEVKRAAARLGQEDRVLILTRWMPAMNEVVTVWEGEHNRTNRTLFLIFPDVSTQGWRLMAMPSSIPVVNRALLPQVWTTFGDDMKALANTLKIDLEITFVHRARFMAGAPTIDACVAMALVALEQLDREAELNAAMIATAVTTASK